MGTLTNETTTNQRDMILRFMEDYGSINPAQAIEEFGCYRLGARIWDLRDAGYSIKTEMVERVNRYGRKVKFAQYSLEEEENE